MMLGQALAERLIYSAFQPIVAVATQTVFAYESLARSRTPAFPNPHSMFQAASDERRIGELGRYLRMSSVDGAAGWPLFINVDPQEFDEGWLVRPDDPFFWHDHQVYMEITEAVPLSHFAQCNSVIAEMRAKGVRLVIDDLGAGFSNLKYISDLSPDVVKLDRDLVAGLDALPRQRRLVGSVVRLCHQMGAAVVAEGVETVEELRAVIDAEVDMVQGYLLARPALPPPMPTWPL